MNTLSTDRGRSRRPVGLVWWRWSVLVSFGVFGIEVLGLVVLGFGRTGFEFAGVAAPFLAIALVAALVVDPVLIFLWLPLARRVPALRARSWLVVFVLVLCVPVFLGPWSWYELALAAPSVLGFLLPRFVVPQLSQVPETGQ